jgi:hypothetical protein
MALILDGNGLIQGLDAGGLPSGSVNADTLASTLDLSSKTMTFGNVSASGITFPASVSASGNANTLDDYEEGTWTPVLARTGSSYTFSLQSGRYTKIGNIVTCTFSVVISAIGTQGSSFNTITGFPFTPASIDSGNLRYTGSLSIRAVLTSATNFYYSGAFFFNDASNALQTNFTTGDCFGVITFQV